MNYLIVCELLKYITIDLLYLRHPLRSYHTYLCVCATAPGNIEMYNNPSIDFLSFSLCSASECIVIIIVSHLICSSDGEDTGGLKLVGPIPKEEKGKWIILSLPLEGLEVRIG